MTVTQARAPFKIGAKVRYPGREGTGFRRDHPDGTPGSWVRPGDIGVVVATRTGTPGHPEMGEEFAEPFNDWSVIRFHDDPTTDCAVSAENVEVEEWDGWVRRWERA